MSQANAPRTIMGSYQRVHGIMEKLLQCDLMQPPIMFSSTDKVDAVLVFRPKEPTPSTRKQRLVLCALEREPDIN